MFGCSHNLIRSDAEKLFILPDHIPEFYFIWKMQLMFWEIPFVEKCNNISGFSFDTHWDGYESSSKESWRCGYGIGFIICQLLGKCICTMLFKESGFAIYLLLFLLLLQTKRPFITGKLWKLKMFIFQIINVCGLKFFPQLAYCLLMFSIFEKNARALWCKQWFRIVQELSFNSLK